MGTAHWHTAWILQDCTLVFIHFSLSTVKPTAGLVFPICGHQPPRITWNWAKQTPAGCAVSVSILLWYLSIFSAHLMSSVKLEMAHPGEHCPSSAAGHSRRPVLPTFLLLFIFLASVVQPFWHLKGSVRRQLSHAWSEWFTVCLTVWIWLPASLLASIEWGLMLSPVRLPWWWHCAPVLTPWLIPTLQPILGFPVVTHCPLWSLLVPVGCSVPPISYPLPTPCSSVQ